MTGERHRILDADTAGMPRCHEMVNINGPSVIRRPDWVDLPSTYLLYFAHHFGTHIRVAHADSLTGPWTIVDGGVLHVDDTPSDGFLPHVASPDVHVLGGRTLDGRTLDGEPRLRMYLHCPIGNVDPERTGEYIQGTVIAESTDGTTFSLVVDTAVTTPYLRMVRRPDAWYGISMQDWLWRTVDGLTGWESRRILSDDNLRHVGLDLVGDRLDVYYTSFVDPPERVKRRSIDLRGDWSTWETGPVDEVLRPTEAWEGADLEVTASYPGPTAEPQHALRDPFVFTDDDGGKWLFYSGAGEFAMGVTRLR